jgi:hypothetical protein
VAWYFFSLRCNSDRGTDRIVFRLSSKLTYSPDVFGLDFMRSIITQMSKLQWLLVIPSSLIGLGLIFKGIDYLLAWAKEIRELKAGKITKEKDRPRFRVDATKMEGTHPNVPTVHVEIHSLGGLPLTIKDGYVAIEPVNNPGTIHPESLRGKSISPSAPIVVEFKVAGKYIYPMGVTERYTIKLICKFSYEENKPYEDEQHYNRQTQKFEHLH